MKQAIFINLRDKDSITMGERQKKKCENKGYTLIEESVNNDIAKLVYSDAIRGIL